MEKLCNKMCIPVLMGAVYKNSLHLVHWHTGCFYCIFEHYICGVFWKMSLRMATIMNTLLHMKPTLAWEMYDPGLSCDSTYLILLKSFKMPSSCTVAGLTLDNFQHTVKFLSGNISGPFKCCLSLFVMNMDFSYKIRLLMSPTTNNSPHQNLEIQGTAVCQLVTVCCVEEFATWPRSCTAWSNCTFSYSCNSLNNGVRINETLQSEFVSWKTTGLFHVQRHVLWQLSFWNRTLLVYVKHNDKSTQFCLKVLIDTFKCLILPYLKSVVDIVCLIL